MSVIENIQKLFKTKPAAPQDSMDDVSLDMSVDPLATGAMSPSGSVAAAIAAEEAGGGNFRRRPAGDVDAADR
jgi:twitching motility protein PilJ